MRAMQTLEYAYLVQELQPLAGQRFDKIYDIGENKFRIKIGNSDLIIHLGVCMYAARQIPESAELGNFSQKARKELEGKKLQRVFQTNHDRIVVFEFGGHQFILEMFSQGNAILIHNQKILACYRNEQWKDRSIRAGETYRLPPPPADSVRSCLSSKYAVADLAKLPFGTLYIKEALARCSIEEKKPGNTLTEKEINCLETVLSQFRSKARPRIFYQQGRAVDYGLLPFASFSDLESKEFPTLSEAVEVCALEPVEEKNPLLEKLERRLQKQQEALQKLKQEEAEARQKGDAIYAHYQQTEEILATAKRQKKKEVEINLP